MPNTKFPYVSIIILNWNSWKDTIECLESVFKLNYPNFAVFLFDNGSKNESVSKIINWANGNEELKLETNLVSLVFPLMNKPIKFENIKLEHKNSNINKGQHIFP